MPTRRARRSPLAQAIGGWGNWWNQELFGRPTTLPWGLEIDPEHRPTGYAQDATFHPTFLYESLWCLILCVGLIAIGKRFGNRLKAGSLFWMYVAGYTFVRFFIERIRIDEASRLWGLRVNEWVSAVVFLASVAILVMMNLHEPELQREGRGTRGRSRAVACP